MNANETILFREEQRFRQGWVWFTFLLSIIVTIAAIVVAVSVKQESKADMVIVFVVVIPVQLLVASLLYYTKLQTQITTKGIRFRWAPLTKFKQIRWEELKKVEVLKGPPLQYGFHLTIRYGRVHKVTDGKGMQLYLKNGRKIFLGTQRLNAFREAVEKMMEHQSK
jgi:heme/copper-type cytochrome/quinol oxidase subunit 4